MKHHRMRLVVLLSVILLVVVPVTYGQGKAPVVGDQSGFQEIRSDPAASLDVIRGAVRAGQYLDAYGEIFRVRDSDGGGLAELSQRLSDGFRMITPQSDSLVTREIVLLLSARSLVDWFSGDYEAALAAAGTIVLIEPGNAYGQIIQAGAEAAIGAPDDTSTQFAEAAVAAGNNAHLLGLIAAMQFDIFAVEGMFEHSDQAIALAPDLAHAYRLRGLARRIAGDVGAAAEDAERALELDPDYFGFYIFRGSLEAASGNLEAALDDVNAAIERSPGSRIGHGIRSDIFTALGQPERAAQDFARFIAASATEEIAANSLTSGVPVRLTMTQGRVYLVPFEARDGQTVSVHVTSVTPTQVDPVALIVGPQETPLVFNDDQSDGSLDAMIADYAISESGAYTLVVSHALGGSEGEIEVEFAVG